VASWGDVNNGPNSNSNSCLSVGKLSFLGIKAGSLESQSTFLNENFLTKIYPEFAVVNSLYSKQFYDGGCYQNDPT